jgi:hypothetical protein
MYNKCRIEEYSDSFNKKKFCQMYLFSIKKIMAINDKIRKIYAIENKKRSVARIDFFSTCEFFGLTFEIKLKST